MSRPVPSRIADKAQFTAISGQSIGVDAEGNLSAKVLAKIQAMVDAGFRMERVHPSDDSAAAYLIYDGSTCYQIEWEALTPEQIILDSLDSAIAEIDDE